MMMGFALFGLLLLGGGLIAVLLGVTGLAFRTGEPSQPAGGRRHLTARQVLDERLARGEIGQEEHEQIRAQIEG